MLNNDFCSIHSGALQSLLCTRMHACPLYGLFRHLLCH